MTGQEHVGVRSARPPRRWQFGLIHLLLLPVGLGLVMAFIIGWYPYSVMMLWVLFFAAIITVGLSVLPGAKIQPVSALIVNVSIYVLATVLGSGCIDPIDPARRSQCSWNLKQVLMALHDYHDHYGCFPPAYVADKNGQPMHSWRVLILPFLEQQALYAQYRFDEPWNGPNNSKLGNVRIPEYQCPEQTASGTPTMTSYVALVGKAAAWPGSAAARFEDFRDATSNTIMVVEMVDSGIHWMEPRDMDAATMTMSVNPKSGVGISSLSSSLRMAATASRGERRFRGWSRPVLTHRHA